MTSNAPGTASKPTRPRSPHFPPHNAPRVWFITRGVSPIAIALAKQVLEHGDYVVAGVIPAEFEKSEGQIEDFKAFLEEVKSTERWRERLRVVGLEARIVGQCQAAVAEAVEAFGRIDVLLCAASEAVIGTVEELAQSSRTISLVDEIFEINFFANVNIIKAILPVMRERKNGHMISLAYEIAPFNVKMSIVQANMEVNVLTNRITSVPPMPEYLSEENPAPLAREIFSGLLDRLDSIENPRPEDATSPTYSTSTMSPDNTAESTIGDLLNADTITSLYAPLPAALKSSLIAETVHALTAIGGHDNPPARHIVGSEGVTAVKEKLMTTSEELEDFIEVSNAVDIAKDYQSVEPSAFD
ncbi:hypothetical protein SLS61_003804 [Didymella pomorum]